MLQFIRIDRKTGRKPINRDADSGRMGLAENGDGQIPDIYAAHIASSFKEVKSSQNAG